MTNLSIKLYGFLMNLVNREEGQDLVEYAVLVGFIGVTAAIALILLFQNNAFGTMEQTIRACVTFDTPNCDLP